MSKLAWGSAVASLLVLGCGMLRLSVPSPLFASPYSTLLYAQDQTLLGARIAADGQWRFPSGRHVPSKFATCLQLYEDRRFPYHPGVDVLALARAAVLNIKQQRIVSGGSTLTMQLARMARGNRERTLGQKVAEIGWALGIELRYSKEEILELYASHAPFGGNVVGIEAAAWRYFGRSAEELSWAEQATLAVLPNAPALIHPGRNRDALRKKRDRLLHILYEEGYLDRMTYELSCLEPLPEKPVPLPHHAPHLLDRMAKERPEEHVFRTTIHSSLQLQVQSIVNSYAAEYRSNYIYNAAALVADVETGEVWAYVGNATDGLPDGQGGQVDIIASPRSTGSILKPFLYAGMLSDGQLLPKTLVPDIPLNIRGFTPQNYSKTFSGAVPAEEAVARSLNVPLVRMLSDYKTGRFMSLLKRMGMTTLRFSESHYGASLILGGAEGTLWDLTGMYASAARKMAHYHRYNGRYDEQDIHPLRLVPGDKPDEGELALTSDPSYAALWFMFEAMADVNRPEEEADWQQFSSMKRVAWKTGTSYGGRDAWAIGVTPRFAVGVWVGNANGAGRPGLTGVGNAAPILFDIFSLLPDSPWFDEPLDDLARLPICRTSGHKATSACTPVDTLYVPRAGMRTEVCPYHRWIHLSADRRYRVNSSCASVSEMVRCPWFVLPPVQAYYYQRYHLDYQPLPPLKPGCEDESAAQIAILYPEHQAVLYIPRGLSGEPEKVVMRAAHVRPDATLYWHLDEVYLGETHREHQWASFIEPGHHILTLVDERGNRRSVLFEVKE